MHAMRPRRLDNLLQLIGNTPVVRIKSFVDADSAELWGKCEHQNPGGSVKDRIALSMIESAEAEGRIQPGKTTIVEATSGNTGIGLALVCAVKRYRLVLCMPESMSLERRELLKAYGAELVLTDEVRHMEGAMAAARELLARDPATTYMPQQFDNPANPEVHRRTTGPEILAQLDGAPDGFVAGIGTGGTITGVGQVLKAANPKIRIVGVEPVTSAVLAGGQAGPHKIQGIGAGFVPGVLDRGVIDEVRSVSDAQAYQATRALATREGLLVGISSGAAVHIARDLARELGPGKRVVTILPDTGERYFSLDEYFR
jgi:cysteine synthase A